MKATLVTGIAALLAAAFPGAPSAEEPPGMAPGEPAAPTVEALLPELLRADHGPPYSMAAIRFGPEFWAALEADADQNRQARNMLRNLFEGGLLFGIGPLNNLLAVAKQDRTTAAQPATRWAAPPTMRAALHLQGDQTEIILEGQRAQWVRRYLPGADPDNLINQLEFLWFDFEPAVSGQVILGDTFRSMTLNLVGLAAGAMQTFTWTLQPPPAYAPGQAPLVVRREGGYQGHYRSPAHDLREWLGHNRAGAGQPGRGHDVARGVLGGGTGVAGLRGPPVGIELEAPAEAIRMLPAIQPATAPAPAGPPAARGLYVTPSYPVARAASNVSAEGQQANQLPLNQAGALWESYAAIEQVTRGDGSVTVAYWTSPSGRREVEVISRDGDTRDRVTSGPASADGKGMATWGVPKADAEDTVNEFAFVVRNTVDTPQGTQITEAVVPVSHKESANEPEGAMAPPPAVVADLTIVDISVANEFLQVRASVGVLGDRQPVVVPPLHVTITDEAGRTVQEFDPQSPAAGTDYVFAWDSRDADGERVPDGRYLLRIATQIRSDRGLARSELRYWIEVPLEKTQKRLAILDPTTFVSLQARVDSVQDDQARFTYVLPARGTVRIAVTDADGRVVRHLQEAQLDAGPYTVTWDGADDNGRPVPGGTYTVQFEFDGGDRGAWGALIIECPFQSALTEG